MIWDSAVDRLFHAPRPIPAAAHGSELIVQARRLWRAGGNRTAWGLHRYSSMYLGFIFGALVLDTLLRH